MMSQSSYPVHTTVVDELQANGFNISAVLGAEIDPSSSVLGLAKNRVLIIEFLFSSIRISPRSVGWIWNGPVVYQKAGMHENCDKRLNLPQFIIFDSISLIHYQDSASVRAIRRYCP